MLKIPDGVSVEISGSRVCVSGKHGKVEKDFGVRGLVIERAGDSIRVSGVSPSVGNAVLSHLRNMLKGAAEGYAVNMQVVYSHFPISVEVKGGEVMVKNFLGERKPRRARIVGSTKVEVKGQFVTVSGPSKEDVGQTVANLRSAVKIPERDSRVFQDGLYVVEG